MKEKYDLSCTLKLIDPSYAIRAPAANASDTNLCAKLAQSAVDGAMAGYTAFSTGVVRNTVAWIPIKTINEAGMNTISTYDRSW